MWEDSNGQSGSRSPRSTTRRRVLQTGAVTTGIAIAGCLNGSGDSLTFISRGGTTQEAEREKFEEWSEESGIEVTHQEAAGDTEILNLIAENPDAFDFTNPSSSGLTLHRSQYDGELFADIDYDHLPNYRENIQEEWQNSPAIDGHDDGIFYYISTQGIGYNRDQVDEITTWEDIKDDGLEGTVALIDNAQVRFGNACAALEYDTGEAATDDAMFEDVIAEMEEQHTNVFGYWTAGNEFMQLMREDQAYVASAWGGRVQVMNKDGYNVEYVIPDEGCVAHTNYFSIVENSDKKEDVYDLLDWLYDTENAIELSTRHNYPIPITDPPEELTSLFEYVDHPDDLTWIDWPAVLSERERIIERFNEIKSL